jgi:phage tail sheath protein FI
MGFQLSPGVQVSEIDLTTIVPSVATSIGGIAGLFAWGPVNEVVTISDEVRLVDRFGKPSNGNAEYWFSAANFLAYSNTLKVVRAGNTTSTLNATTEGTGIHISSEDDYEANHATGANTNGQWAARWPGDLGNSIRVELVDSGTYSGWDYEGAFTAVPNTSTQAASVGGSEDEMHIIVIDELGRFTGTPNTVLEKYEFVSKAFDAKTFDGTSNYYKNVINTRSRYIWWLSHPDNVDLSSAVNWGGNSATAFVTTTSVVAAKLSGGADGTVSTGDIVRAYDAFANADTIDVNLLISGPAGATVVNHLIDNIAESRKDCVVFISPEKSDVVNNYGDEVTDSVAFRNTLTSSSYGVMDSNWKYQFDKYNDVYRWIPLNGDIAGLCARTDQDRDPWYSPGGLNRGIIKNVVKLAWNPNKTDRDGLYVAGINPVVTFAGEGTVLFGDKTLLARPSAFDRINVRRLFIVLEKAIARAARSSLFEFNDTFTRAQFVNLVEPFLRDVQGRRGIFDFRVVCDETNNTGEVIDRNEFIGDIYIKPARSINFIQLNFVAVRTGVSFDEVVGKFG